MAKPQQLWVDRIESDLGVLLLVSDGEALCALDFEDYEPRMQRLLNQRYSQVTLRPKVNPNGFSDRLRAYFQGDFAGLDHIQVNPGGTAFQQQVWLALRHILPGTTLSYGQLAQHIGHPTASRAVGMANSLNPIAIVLPCHRVVGANGSLTGYAGGIERKRWLLDHECGILHLNLA